MEADVRIEKVDEFETRGGNTRYVVGSPESSEPAADTDPEEAAWRRTSAREWTPRRTEFGAAAK